MGFWLNLETDGNTRIYLSYPGGTPGGKPLSALVRPLAAFCEQPNQTDEADIRDWFSKLESHARRPLCHVAEPLLHWDSPEKGSGDAAVTPWLDTQLVLASMYELLQAFERSNLGATWWCEPDWLLADLRALVKAVDSARLQGSKRVRLIIS